MKKQNVSNIPADAAARQAAPAVICYPTTDLPQPDMVNLERARTNLTKISEIIVPPRDARSLSGPGFRRCPRLSTWDVVPSLLPAS